MPKSALEHRLEPSPANLGARLFLEVEQSFETVGGIAEGFGLPTLVDLWWLANVIVANPGERAIQSPGSRLRRGRGWSGALSGRIRARSPTRAGW